MSTLDLFLVDTAAVTHWRWQGGTLVALARHATSQLDTLRSQTLARRCAILVDLPDEGFVLDVHNHLSRRNQIARSRIRLAEQWRHTPYRRARPLADGKSTLLCALPQYSSIDALLATLNECDTIVLGVYSVAQLVADFAPRAAGPRLLAFAAPGGGLRQCFQLAGELRFSRLSDHGQDYEALAADEYAAHLASEVRQASHHLVAEHQLTRGDTLRITVLAGEQSHAIATALHGLLYDEGGYHTDALRVDQLAGGQHGLLAALAARLAHACPDSHYGSPAHLYRRRLQRLLHLGNRAVLALVVAALGYACYAHFETVDIVVMQQQLARESVARRDEIARLSQMIGPHLAETEQMATVQEFDRRYISNWPALIPQLKAISQQLDGLPRLAIQRVHWQVELGETDGAVPQPTVELAGNAAPPYRAAASELDTLRQRLGEQLHASMVAENRPRALDETTALEGEDSDEATHFALRFLLPPEGRP
ncbi:hypothetical protein [Chitinolyticbacter meiyuanensis]|uniref:hypothetical protein n=1 Tax=Chitinolyticbacter meiyuanensis TaxID=682798 RepID=UPI0011E60841|nr:hypothetical protein [Chitinolyticbacter meiyuanensis]